MPSLRQVSVAVLLDNFINYTIKMEEEDTRKRKVEQRSRNEVMGGRGVRVRVRVGRG